MKAPLRLPVARVLPVDIRDALIRASWLDPKSPRGESLERIAAIDEIVRRARLTHPHLFK